MKEITDQEIEIQIEKDKARDRANMLANRNATPQAINERALENGRTFEGQRAYEHLEYQRALHCAIYGGRYE